jgi:UDP-N-acetylmuramoyl-L-alanyl-D-glutamate--2,6-diaminopimelate ligase
MTVGEILSGAGAKEPIPPELAASTVTGLEYDSRKVAPGNLFFAFPGSRVDGRRFAQAALESGALAAVSELTPLEGLEARWIEVDHGRRALAKAARAFYRRPDERLRLTAITGTNGKTTTCYLVDSILRAAGFVTGMIGTIEYHVAGRVLPAVNTTPESLDLLRLLDELEQAGGRCATMEVSSHALELGRVYGLDFHTAAFSNLTRDHLDFHRTMEAYFAAKQRLFDGAGGRPPRRAVVNWDDEHGRRLRIDSATELYRYGFSADSDLRPRHVSSGFQGLKFDVQFGKLRFPVQSPLIGKINVYNILAACGVGLSYGLAPELVARGVAQCRSVPGRFERVDMGQPFVVAVDYAHTDDALKNAIAVARTLNPKRVITLFGCGGDRDRDKRPLMGQAAAEASDFVILTSDNPRSEDPLAIMNDALVGIRRTDTRHVVEPDRATAIARALKEAREGDVVLLAGKGHETYQILKDGKIHFDDREVAREVLKGFGYSNAS